MTRSKETIIIAFVLIAALSACNSVTLSKGAELACKGQAAANIATEAAAALGYRDIADGASATSKALGLACKW